MEKLTLFFKHLKARKLQKARSYLLEASSINIILYNTLKGSSYIIRQCHKDVNN